MLLSFKGRLKYDGSKTGIVGQLSAYHEFLSKRLVLKLVASILNFLVIFLIIALQEIWSYRKKENSPFKHLTRHAHACMYVRF